MVRVFLAVFFLASLVSGPVAAQHATGAALTLEQLVSEAQARSPQLRAFQAEIDAARGEALSARAWMNPELSVSPGVRRADGSEFHGEAELLQTFDFPGKRGLRRAAAEKGVEARAFALEAFRQQLAIQVRRAYYASLVMHQLIALNEQQLALANGFADAARTKVDGGFAPEFEATKAEVEVVRARRTLREMQARHLAVHAELNALLGRDVRDETEVTGTLPVDSIPEIDKEAIQSWDVSRNPSLRIQAAETNQLELGVQLAKKSRLPDFTVGPNIEYVQDEQTYGIGIGFVLPLWDRKQGAISTAKAEHARALAESDAIRREVVRDVAIALNNLESTRESLAYFTPAFSQRLKAALDTASESYANGRTTFLIYLETQRTYFETQTAYYETLRDYFDAQFGLEAALGITLAELKHANSSKEGK